MYQSDDITEITKAMIEVQKEISGVKKNAENPFFKSNYADLKACIETASPILTKHGLSVLQPMDGKSVVTILAHESGQWIAGRLELSPDKSGMQALGSAITYARRYSYSAMIGLHQEDDDAESTENRGTKHKPDGKKMSKAPVSTGKISESNLEMLRRAAHRASYTDSELNEYLKEEYDIDKAEDIPVDRLGEIMNKIKKLQDKKTDDIPF